MKKLLPIVSALALAVSAAGTAGAAMIAGWDHSAYVPGFLSVDAATLTDTLAAQYSDLDPTFGAGLESAAFGTLFLNGQFGSTATPLDGTDPYSPFSPGLSQNATAPGGVPFGSVTVLTAEGAQLFENDIAMLASGPTLVVYAANLGSVPEVGSDWFVTFAGLSLDGAAQVGIEFSTDGSSYTSFGQVNLTGVDTAFSVALGATASDLAFVRLSFGSGNPLIDNVGIHATLGAVVPEPGTVLLLGAGLGGLALIGRRRD